MNTVSFVTALLYVTASTLPYRLLAYYPFRKQLRFPLWVVALVVGIAQVLQSFLYAFLSAAGHNGARLLEFIFAPACLIIFLLCVSADIWKALFLYVFIFDYTALVRGTARYIESLLFYRADMTFDTLRSMTIQLVILVLTAPVMVLFFRNTKDRVFLTEAPPFWRIVWLLPTFTTIIVMLYTRDQSPGNVRQFRFFLAYFLMFAGLFVVYYVLIRALDGIRHQAALEEQAAQQKHLLALQRTQYNQLSRHMKETREARHDLMQHLRVMNSYLDVGNYEALKEYMKQYEMSLPPNTTRTWCKNFAVNTIVSYYAHEVEKEGIDFFAQIVLPEILPVEEPEFCSVLGNLLENALAACREETGSAPFIRVLVNAEETNVILAVDNTCTRKPIMENGQFRSTHHEGFGTGTASVRTIAARHQGRADYKWEDKVFYASVLMFGK